MSFMADWMFEVEKRDNTLEDGSMELTQLWELQGKSLEKENRLLDTCGAFSKAKSLCLTGVPKRRIGGDQKSKRFERNTGWMLPNFLKHLITDKEFVKKHVGYVQT